VSITRLRTSWISSSARNLGGSSAGPLRTGQERLPGPWKSQLCMLAATARVAIGAGITKGSDDARAPYYVAEIDHFEMPECLFVELERPHPALLRRLLLLHNVLL
jgi:hypothetical protein